METWWRSSDGGDGDDSKDLLVGEEWFLCCVSDCFSVWLKSNCLSFWFVVEFLRRLGDVDDSKDLLVGEEWFLCCVSDFFQCD